MHKYEINLYRPKIKLIIIIITYWFQYEFLKTVLET